MKTINNILWQLDIEIRNLVYRNLLYNIYLRTFKHLIDWIHDLLDDNYQLFVFDEI